MKIMTHPDGILRALTIDEPYASLIVGGIKTAENRGWKWHRTFPLPMTLAIHSSCNDRAIGPEFDELLQDDTVFEAFNNPNVKPCQPGSDFFYGGCIMGLVDVVGCVQIANRSDDEILADLRPLVGDDADECLNWCSGPYSFILRNPRRFKTPVACKGFQLIWKLPTLVQQQCFQHAEDCIPFPEMPTLPVNGKPKMLGKVKQIA
jgi:ASCH domain